MRTLKRILAIVVIALCVVGILAAAAGIVGVWRANGPITEALVKTVSGLEAVVGGIGDGLERLTARLDTASAAVALVEDTVTVAGDTLAQSTPVLELLNRIFGDQLLPSVSAGLETARSLGESALAFNSALEAVNSVPLVSVPTLPPELTSLAQDLVDLENHGQAGRARDQGHEGGGGGERRHAGDRAHHQDAVASRWDLCQGNDGFGATGHYGSWVGAGARAASTNHRSRQYRRDVGPGLADPGSGQLAGARPRALAHACAGDTHARRIQRAAGSRGLSPLAVGSRQAARLAPPGWQPSEPQSAQYMGSSRCGSSPFRLRAMRREALLEQPAHHQHEPEHSHWNAETSADHRD